MAVSKLWKVTQRLGQVIDYATNPEKTANPEYTQEEYQALKDVLAYAKDEEKTEREFFCEGINCNVSTPVTNLSQSKSSLTRRMGFRLITVI